MNYRDHAIAQFQQSIETPTRFFETNADALSQACFAMAKRFLHGGRLLVFGNGASATDAQHVSVEFVHPVIVGKRALPAIALTNDIASLLGITQTVGVNEIFAQQVRLLGTRHDIALGLTLDGDDESVRRGLSTANALGLLTIGMAGGDGGALARTSELDYCFVVPSDNPQVIQEVHETAYHILWETVHVFFEHKGLFA
ncbi:MAG: SIS domain-containing protein [Chloroflexi bacterium]|nr:SIS domain-containing protein [Chloroflexota bacterium]